MRPIIKKVLKITAIILLVLVLLISGVIFWILHSLKAELGDHWKDYANAFTMQTVASKELPSLENIEQYTVDVQFISKEGNVDSRPIKLYVPENASQPMPLIYVPHYEMASNSLELRRYLEKGWAVASPSEVKSKHNGLLRQSHIDHPCDI